MKTALMLVFMIFMGISFFVTDIKKYIYITLFFVFFPIIIPFMGRDAMTTGTVCILLLYLKYYKNSQKLIMEQYDGWLYLLIVLGTASIMLPFLTGVLDNSQFGPAVRHYMGFIGAILLFIVLKNSLFFSSPDQSTHWRKETEKLLSFILLMISSHILISIGIKYFPSIGSIFKPFLSRELKTLDMFGRGEIERIGTFVFSYESLAEIIAALAPIVLYKMFTQRSSWFFIFFFFGLGVLFTTTRSGVLLFVLASTSSILFFSRKNFGKVYALTYSSALILALSIFFETSFYDDLAFRFQAAAETYRSGGTFFQLINRQNVFISAWDLTIKNLSFFGNGVTEFNYHNLFLTILHQLGISGVAVFFGVFLYPLILLMKKHFIRLYQPDRAIVYSCLLSYAIFLINECKFEFNRDSSYQQLWWAIFAIYYVIAKMSCTRNSVHLSESQETV